MLKLNLEFLIAERDMCSVLTTVRVPKSVNVTELRRKLRESSIIIYEGKGCFKDKVFQVGNIGEISNADIEFFLQTLKEALLVSRLAVVVPMAQVGQLKTIQPHVSTRPGSMVPIAS